MWQPNLFAPITLAALTSGTSGWQTLIINPAVYPSLSNPTGSLPIKYHALIIKLFCRGSRLWLTTETPLPPVPSGISNSALDWRLGCASENGEPDTNTVTIPIQQASPNSSMILRYRLENALIGPVDTTIQLVGGHYSYE